MPRIQRRNQYQLHTKNAGTHQATSSNGRTGNWSADIEILVKKKAPPKKAGLHKQQITR